MLTKNTAIQMNEKKTRTYSINSEIAVFNESLKRSKTIEGV
jgi:hypothetical protein